MFKLLLIGPRTNKKDPSRTGGIIVLFEDLLSQCKAMNINFEVIDTNKANYSNKIIAYMYILFYSIMKTSKATHVSLHGTANDYMLIAPVVVFFSKLFEKHISLRKFAGNFDVLYNKSSYIQKRIIDYALRKSDVNFFETKYLVEKFKSQNKCTYWFPNVRKNTNFTVGKIYQKKFVFLGHVSKEKGIMELLNASKLLDDSYTIDIYGSLIDDIKKINFHEYNVNYKGTLTPGDVQQTFSGYNILVLPSYREGYPGVIIEALSVGLPIIATNLEGIKEMVNDKSSILIDPKNTSQLKEAIESFNEKNYIKKSAFALKQFENFDSDKQTEKFLKKIGISD